MLLKISEVDLNNLSLEEFLDTTFGKMSYLRYKPHKQLLIAFEEGESGRFMRSKFSSGVQLQLDVVKDGCLGNFLNKLCERLSNDLKTEVSFNNTNSVIC